MTTPGAPGSIDDIRDFVPLSVGPVFLNQAVFDEVVGAILADSRSGQADRGRPSPHVRFGRTSVSSPPFEQVWTLQGYSRGALVNSITLAPQEELSIEVFTWSKSKSEEERTVSSEMEKNTEIGSMSRASNSVARDLSETTDTRGDIGLGIPLAPAGLPVDVNAQASVSSQVKMGIQGSIDQIHESTRRSTERIKSTQQVKVVQTNESGREDRTIRKIRNANGSRSLTMNYFEVLENYKVVTKLKETKRFCVLVHCPDLGEVDPAFVLAYEDRLQRALRSPNYLPGFEAGPRSWSPRRGSTVPRSSRQQKTVLTVARNLRDVLDRLLTVDLLKAAEVLAQYYNPLDDKEVLDAERTEAEEALGLYNFWFKYKLVSPGMEGKARTFVEAVTDDATEAVVVEALTALLAGVDDEWLTALKLIAANAVAIQLSCMLLIPFPSLLRCSWSSRSSRTTPACPPCWARQSRN
jgi:hypothetical protein